MNQDQTLGTVVIMFTFIVIGIILLTAKYVLDSLAMYTAFVKANVKNPWLAWVPIGRLWPYMDVIKKRYRNIWWILCPVANFVFLIIWQGRYYKAFGMSRYWLLGWLGVLVSGSAVSILWTVLQCVIGFSNGYRYNPDFDVPTEFV